MKSLVRKIKSVLSISIVVAAVLGTSLIYQNCGGEFKATDLLQSSLSSSSNSDPVVPPDQPGNKVGTATLSWDANSESDLTGYKVYYGTSLNRLDKVIDLRSKTTTPAAPRYDVSDLVVGTTYYFAVTAYSPTGESTQSQVVSKTIQ